MKPIPQYCTSTSEAPTSEFSTNIVHHTRSDHGWAKGFPMSHHCVMNDVAPIGGRMQKRKLWAAAIAVPKLQAPSSFPRMCQPAWTPDFIGALLPSCPLLQVHLDSVVSATAITRKKGKSSSSPGPSSTSTFSTHLVPPPLLLNQHSLSTKLSTRTLLACLLRATFSCYYHIPYTFDTRVNNSFVAYIPTPPSELNAAAQHGRRRRTPQALGAQPSAGKFNHNAIEEDPRRQPG